MITTGKEVPSDLSHPLKQLRVVLVPWQICNITKAIALRSSQIFRTAAILIKHV